MVHKEKRRPKLRTHAFRSKRRDANGSLVAAAHPRDTAEESSPRWKRDILVAVISGSVVAIGSIYGAAVLDDQRSAGEERLENLRFVRERSTEAETVRPFRNMDLQDQNLSGLELSGSDLSKANLRNAQLYIANLKSANLLLADMEGSDLFATDLRGADLDSTKLKNANLEGARLGGATLRSADMSGANLTNADLTDADMSRSWLHGADLSGTVLTSRNFESGTEDTPCFDDRTKWPEGFAVPDSSKNEVCKKLTEWPWFKD